MTADSTPSGSLPAEVLRGVPWSFFEGETFTGRDEFVRRVNGYGDFTEPGFWDPDAVVLPAPRVRITYFGVESPDDDEYQDFETELASGDQVGFTASELLFKLNNAVAPHVAGVDHCYFEGLVLSEERGEGGVPVYRMEQGS